ncbi:MAG: hypothetical protein JSV53_06750 [candidate division WOR-3 bacterium]|nr:MAG: hypothetical protein JSV53_06750 [candidate division WOR-3 bacterium]
MRYCLVLAVIVGLCGATNYITNGDFEQPLSPGWFQSSYGTDVTITRGTAYHPDPDNEVYLYKYGTGTTGMGHAILYQTTDIPTTNINVSFDAAMYAWDNYPGIWAASAVIVGYLDSDGALLGETRVTNMTDECPWVNGATMHLLPVTDDDWHSYSFNIDDELMYLPGVDPEQVSKVKVTLMDTMISC